MQLFLSQWIWMVMVVPLFWACSSRPVKTIENLKNVVVSEQNSAIRYGAFSQKAKEEGFRNVANLLEAISRSEEIHAESQRKFLKKIGEQVGEATDSIPKVGTTLENLRQTVRVEMYESQTVFPIFVAAAASEGVTEAEQFFDWLGEIALRQADCCRKALERLEKEGTDWNVVNSWSVCPGCGCPYKTASLDEVCDMCAAPASSFILFQ